MVAELKTNNMARTTGRSGFKMRSGNTPLRQETTGEVRKKTLGSEINRFFSDLDAGLQAGAQRHSDWKDKRKEASKDTLGRTKMDRDRAEKKTRKPGESKFQADVRRKKEFNKECKATLKASLAARERKTYTLEEGKKRRAQVEADYKLYHGEDSDDASSKSSTPSPPTGEKITGALGSKTRKEQYDAKGWKYDDTIKGYNRDGTKIKTKVKAKVKKTKLGGVDPKTGNVNLDYGADYVGTPKVKDAIEGRYYKTSVNINGRHQSINYQFKGGKYVPVTGVDKSKHKIASSFGRTKKESPAKIYSKAKGKRTKY